MDNSRSFSYHVFVCLIISLSVLSFMPLSANEYRGRVVDSNGQGISYATVYIAQQPSLGTATGTDGSFVLYSTPEPYFTVIISFIGYEKQEMPLSVFADTVPVTVVLKEQPIALEETVVAAKPHKQRNKRKQMAELLYKVYNQMLYDFPEEPVGYTVVSDVRMDSKGQQWGDGQDGKGENTGSQTWGAEQMIASVVCLPEQGRDGRDSVQFAGQLCKRFFNDTLRKQVDNIIGSKELQKKKKELKMVTSIDSGVIVHSKLWEMGDIRYGFKKNMKNVRNWEVNTDNENEIVLTYTEKHNFIGIFKMEMKRHYVLNAYTYSVLRFSEEAMAEAHIPFGYKVKGVYLDMLNLINMSNEKIEKYRLKHMYSHVRLNTFYQHRDEGIYLKEKNMVADVTMIDNKDGKIPLYLTATQLATQIQTHDVTLLPEEALKKRVPREIVEIY